jgi:nucleotide-binding universal stress UspA family protein
MGGRRSRLGHIADVLRTIVCGIHDPQDARVARYASQLARRVGSRLDLVRVTEPDELPGDGLLAAVESIAGLRLDTDGVDVSVAGGEPPEALAAVAGDADLLVIGSSHSNALTEALQGGVASSITRDPPVPVLVVPRDDVPDRVAGGIVCGVLDRRDVAPAATAASLAAELGASLSLVHVVMPTVTESVGPGVALPLEEAAVRGAEELLDELATALAESLGEEPPTRVLAGPPGRELARVASEERAGLVAVGASDRGPLAAAVAGSASRYAARHARCPTLVCPRGELR